MTRDSGTPEDPCRLSGGTGWAGSADSEAGSFTRPEVRASGRAGAVGRPLIPGTGPFTALRYGEPAAARFAPP